MIRFFISTRHSGPKWEKSHFGTSPFETVVSGGNCYLMLIYLNVLFVYIMYEQLLSFYVLDVVVIQSGR